MQNSSSKSIESLLSLPFQATPSPPLRSLTLSRLAPRRGKKQAKRNLPQLMTAARHQLRRAMPASVPSRLPASYLPPRCRDRILQPPVKRSVSSEKRPRRKRRPSCPALWSRNESKSFLQVRRRLGIYFPFRDIFWQFWLPVWVCVCNSNLRGNKGGRCEATGVPQMD